MKSIFQLINELWINKNLIWKLAKNDFKTRFAGSIFGIVWAFVQPLMTLLTFWFVFQVGFRTAPIKDIPFICWLAAGLIPWFFFSEALSNSVNCFSDYSYLVKKVVFKVSMLPLIKITSTAFIHIVFVIFLILIFAIYGYYPKLIYIQLIYYSFCMAVLASALTFITASIAPFFKDINNIVGIILQFGMWLTPILWSDTMVPSKYSFLFKLNPMYYIVEGYRDTLIDNYWFWNRYNKFAAFWFITICLFLLGAFFYKKLKPHFADVL